MCVWISECYRSFNLLKIYEIPLFFFSIRPCFPFLRNPHFTEFQKCAVDVVGGGGGGGGGKREPRIERDGHTAAETWMRPPRVYRLITKTNATAKVTIKTKAKTNTTTIRISISRRRIVLRSMGEHEPLTRDIKCQWKWRREITVLGLW